ncbi:hypothetical protein PMIN04_007562 [Paraphaeosphaeria minitans]
MRSSILAVGVALGAGLGVFASPTPPPESGFDERSEMRDVFKKLKASANTDWQPCHYWFQCMVLRMPLDHDDSSLGTVAIGFVKSPADEKSKDPQDILFNPGGPGASGIEVMVDGIDAIRQRLGWEHNIVSFDPRGVGNSYPGLSCYAEPSYKTISTFLHRLISMTTKH